MPRVSDRRGAREGRWQMQHCAPSGLPPAAGPRGRVDRPNPATGRRLPLDHRLQAVAGDSLRIVVRGGPRPGLPGYSGERWTERRRGNDQAVGPRFRRDTHGPTSPRPVRPGYSARDRIRIQRGDGVFPGSQRPERPPGTQATDRARSTVCTEEAVGYHATRRRSGGRWPGRTVFVTTRTGRTCVVPAPDASGRGGTGRSAGGCRTG